MSYPALDTLDPAKVRSLPDHELGALARDMLMILQFEGDQADAVFEMMEAESVEVIRNLTWAEHDRGHPEMEFDPALHDILEPAALIAIASTALSEAVIRGAPALNQISLIGEDACGAISLLIEEWQTRVDDDPNLGELF